MISIVTKLLAVLQQAQNSKLGVIAEFKYIMKEPDQIISFKIEGQGKSCGGEIELTKPGADAKLNAHITQIKNKFLAYEKKNLFY